MAGWQSQMSLHGGHIYVQRPAVSGA